MIDPPAPGEPRPPGSHYDAQGRPKIGYPSRKVAKLKAREIRLSGAGPQWPYRCADGCTGWHLSSSRRIPR